MLHTFIFYIEIFYTYNFFSGEFLNPENISADPQGYLHSDLRKTDIKGDRRENLT